MAWTAVKPIETRYKGYRFRSRLEARWAVFFDTLRWRWEYEPEGVHLDSGRLYLPDFRVASIGAWVEIKPREQFPRSVTEYAALVGDGPLQERLFLLFQGDPWVDSYGIHALNAFGDGLASGPYVLAAGRKDEHEVWLWDEANASGFTLTVCGCCRDEGEPLPHAGVVYDAYERARGARFEQGRRR